MKLHDLLVGQRFSFSDKHRGKVFEVTAKQPRCIVYMDTATNEYRQAFSHREMFRKEVRIETENRLVELTPREEAVIATALLLAIKISAEDGEPESSRNEINKVYLKITGLPGRRVVLPEGEPAPPEFPADRKGGVL